MHGVADMMRGFLTLSFIMQTPYSDQTKLIIVCNERKSNIPTATLLTLRSRTLSNVSNTVRGCFVPAPTRLTKITLKNHFF